MASIHQFLAGYTNRDAISNEARLMRTLFRSWGYASEIFSEAKRILPELRKDARDVDACDAMLTDDDVVLLHLSIGSPLNDRFASLPGRKVILYHNVTPPSYFMAVNRSTADNLARGREQARRLAGVADVTLADSRFNASELATMGYHQVSVLPLILDLDSLVASPDRSVTRPYRDGKTNLLFVGRGAPNKRIEHLLHCLLYAQLACDNPVRLIHVGSYAGTERYYYMLRAHAAGLEMDDLVLAGSVGQRALNAYYQCADVFVCMSEHEGFCIPLLEAMMHDVPVLAYSAAAVPETLDGAGVLFTEKRFDAVAEMAARLARDASLRAAVVAQQRDRLSRYRNRDLEAELKQHLAPLLPATP